MKDTKRFLVIALLLFSFNLTAADELVLGAGASSCAEFITVVDSNWSNPLVAAKYHGFMAWAQGRITGHNMEHPDSIIPPSALEDIKLWLIDYCRDNKEDSYANTVEMLIKQSVP